MDGFALRVLGIGWFNLPRPAAPARIWDLEYSPTENLVLENKGLLKKVLAGLALLLSILLVVQFSTARGLLFDLFRGLPLLESIRTNTRFTAAFVLPLAIIGAKVFDQWSKGKADRRITIAFALVNGLSLVSLWAYFLLPMDVQGRNFEVVSVLKTYKSVQAGETFPVKQIIPEMNDYEVILAQASNVSHHYDPLLGENSFKPRVYEGSVFEIRDGFYNMTDPSGYIFPRENDSDLFSLIPASETDKLNDFVNRRQPDWKLPFIQKLLDWTAGLSFISLLAAGIIYPIKKRSARPV